MTPQGLGLPLRNQRESGRVDFAPWYDTLNRNMLTVTGLSAPGTS